MTIDQRAAKAAEDKWKSYSNNDRSYGISECLLETLEAYESAKGPDWGRAGAKISAISQLLACLLKLGVPYKTLKIAIGLSHGLSLRDFCEWNSKDTSRRDAIVIRKAMKEAGEL